MRSILIISLMLFSFVASAQSSIQGLWATGDNNTVIEITQVQSHCEGKIKSTDNEDVQKGTLILKDLEKSGDTWEGKIYAPKRESWYDVEITPEANQLIVEVSVGFLSRTLEWSRSK
ncbi:DUF2147 domain-containing protein [bacterium SCSIO 12741]|nr:DUF2147 domain-containing protein [bacterium SCSIO 12741]